MDGFLASISPLFTTHPFLAFPLIYVITIILGDIFAFAAFWLIFSLRLGEEYVLTALAVVLFSNVSGDLLFYYLGKYLRDTKIGDAIKNHLPYHNRLESHIQANSRRWIFLSKFIYASTFTIIFLVGWTKVELRTFLRTSLLSIFSWVPLLFALAYALSWSFSSLGAAAAFHKIELLFLAGIISFVIFHWFLGWMIEKLSGKGCQVPFT